jgi:hypothetical protein
VILPARLECRIKRDESGCWLWTGAIASNGYGWLHKSSAHRLVYEAVTGLSVPKGLDIDHLCRVRRCVNPAHLEPVTRSENLRRGLGAQLLRDRFKAQTHCRHGHEFTPENTYITTKGFRSCRECARLRVNPDARTRRGRALMARKVVPPPTIPSKYRTAVCSHCGSPNQVVCGGYLRALRESAGVSLRQMAKRLGLSAAYVSDIERNHRGTDGYVDAYEGLSR